MVTRSDADAPAPPTASLPGTRADARTGLLRRLVTSWLLAALVLIPVSVAVVAVRSTHHHALSPIDEMEHLDYVDRAGHLGLVRSGDTLGFQTRKDVACRGVEIFDAHIATCANPPGPAAYPDAGYNTADIHPPVYYYVTAFGQRVLRDFGAPDDLLIASRWMGGVWLGAGLVLTWLLAAELGASVIARYAVTGLVLASPLVLQQSGSVNVDAASIFCGALLMLTVLRWERGRAPIWLPAVVSAAILAVKATHLVIAIAVGGYLLARWWQQRGAADEQDLDTPGLGTAGLGTAGRAMSGRRARGQRAVGRSVDGLRRPIVAVSVVVAAAVSEVGWLAIKGALAFSTKNDLTTALRDPKLTSQQLVSQLTQFTDPLGGSGVPTTVPGTTLAEAVHLASLVFLVGLVGAWLVRRVDGRVSALGLGGTLAMLVGPLVLVIGTYLSQHVFVILPPRYDFSLLPIFAAVTAGLAGRRASYALAALSLVSVVVSIHAVTLGQI